MVKDNDRSARESSIASGWTVEGEPAVQLPETAPAPSGPGDPQDEESPLATERELSNGALVLLGLVGGIYLLFTFVWFSWANAAVTTSAATASASGSLGAVLQQIVFWIAPFAPALWFVSVLVLCRGKKVRRMMLWLVLGLIVLVPLPMFAGML